MILKEKLFFFSKNVDSYRLSLFNKQLYLPLKSDNEPANEILIRITNALSLLLRSCWRIQ